MKVWRRWDSADCDPFPLTRRPRPKPATLTSGEERMPRRGWYRGIISGPTFVDGGTITAPARAVFGPNGFIAEGEAVHPDIEVCRVAARYAGAGSAARAGGEGGVGSRRDEGCTGSQAAGVSEQSASASRGALR